MIRQPLDAGSHYLEPFHFHPFALLVAGQRAHEVNQVPGVVPIEMRVGRHRGAGLPGYNPLIHCFGFRTPLIEPRAQIARPYQISLRGFLPFGAIASAGPAMAIGTISGVDLYGASFRFRTKGRLGWHLDSTAWRIGRILGLVIRPKLERFS
ncbi:MAG: hypothetical protein A3H94_01525 [Acidobacteria bacterium RIFCSPLOWO2_02_FULL_60_20]|nr:MAG: hypothetical protein A3H94_01525 [Acidobacteria bacterium RIFCSPLOWO2_02_FULL_60_20]